MLSTDCILFKHMPALCMHAWMDARVGARVDAYGHQLLYAKHHLLSAKRHISQHTGVVQLYLCAVVGAILG